MIDFKTATARYSRYYTYLEPVMADPLVRGYFSLVASLLLVTFFVIFALSPTINTILALNKKIADQKKTIAALDTKIVNLVSAQQNFAAAESLVPLLENALPKNPTPETVVHQILVVATNSGVTVSTLQFKPMTLLSDKPEGTPQVPEEIAAMVPSELSPLPVTFSINGNRQTTKSFLQKLEDSLRYIRFNRIGLSFEKNGDSHTDIAGISYYYPKRL